MMTEQEKELAQVERDLENARREFKRIMEDPLSRNSGNGFAETLAEHRATDGRGKRYDEFVTRQLEELRERFPDEFESLKERLGKFDDAIDREMIDAAAAEIGDVWTYSTWCDFYKVPEWKDPDELTGTATVQIKQLRKHLRNLEAERKRLQPVTA